MGELSRLHRIVLELVIPQTPNRPRAKLVNWVPGEIADGAKEPFPQQYAYNVIEIPQVKDSPATIFANEETLPAMAVEIGRFDTTAELSPICPLSARPQQYVWPAIVIPHVCEPLVDNCAQVRPPKIGVGEVRRVVVPSLSCP